MVRLCGSESDTRQAPVVVFFPPEFIAGGMLPLGRPVKQVVHPSQNWPDPYIWMQIQSNGECNNFCSPIPGQTIFCIWFFRFLLIYTNYLFSPSTFLILSSNGANTCIFCSVIVMFNSPSAGSEINKSIIIIYFFILGFSINTRGRLWIMRLGGRGGELSVQAGLICTYLAGLHAGSRPRNEVTTAFRCVRVDSILLQISPAEGASRHISFQVTDPGTWKRLEPIWNNLCV